ncbi:hypothetical protein [Methanogenium sp. MK-MG]|uniref:hypothetical protein n=1 Tax=Methanogenium sp. MK-MG TaxID=2599926 RepID=UPI0013EAE2B4|nr:hypothetical protein [Methanogenium sp. MK-MG]KAF1078468.1 hypothetical protein MKMG_00619 [Methanogenium sp. MK-MG]
MQRLPRHGHPAGTRQTGFGNGLFVLRRAEPFIRGVWESTPSNPDGDELQRQFDGWKKTTDYFCGDTSLLNDLISIYFHKII